MSTTSNAYSSSNNSSSGSFVQQFSLFFHFAASWCFLAFNPRVAGIRGENAFPQCFCGYSRVVPASSSDFFSNTFALNSGLEAKEEWSSAPGCIFGLFKQWFSPKNQHNLAAEVLNTQELPPTNNNENHHHTPVNLNENAPQKPLTPQTLCNNVAGKSIQINNAIIPQEMQEMLLCVAKTCSLIVRERIHIAMKMIEKLDDEARSIRAALRWIRKAKLPGEVVAPIIFGGFQHDDLFKLTLLLNAILREI